MVKVKIPINFFGKNKSKIELRDSLDFSIDEGNILGIYGIKGVGKTTFAKNLAGLLPMPNIGEIRISGKNLYKEITNLYGIIGFVPQVFNENGALTVKEYLNYYASLSRQKSKEKNKKIMEMIEFFELKDWLEKFTDDLTFSEQIIISIARSLIGDPKIIILDDIFINNDHSHNEFLLKIIKKIYDKGKIVIITSSDIHYLLQICNKFCVIENGKIIYLENKEKILEFCREKFAKIIKIESRGYHDKFIEVLLENSNIFGITVAVDYIEFEFKGRNQVLIDILMMIEKKGLPIKKFSQHQGNRLFE